MKTTWFRAIGPAAAAVLLPAVAPAAAPVYTEVSVTDGGTVSGRVLWEGPAADIPPMVINKNVESCNVDGNGVRVSPRLLVSASGGVANAVVFLRDVTEGKPMEKKELSINQKGCRYIPHITIAPRKSKVTLTSSDDVLHNIRMFGAANYNIPFPDKNTVVKSMRKAGVVRVQCDAGHGWMSSYIHVVTHPYYSLSDDEGNFELTDVPPGDYTLTMWHEDWVVANEVTKDGEIVGYEYGEPIEKSVAVTVGAGADVKETFTLSSR